MKIPLRLLLALALAPALFAQSAPSAARLFDGLGSHTRKIATRSADAQKFFDQGLNFYFGFNHGAAIRSFQEAARLDPACAMAHWGIALANGPHINFPMVPPPAAEAAWKELTLAQQHAASATPADRALIAALAKRYANPQPDDRAPLDRAYADAMREAWKSFPRDPDVGVLFAEAMMDLRPWDQWTLAGADRLRDLQPSLAHNVHMPSHIDIRVGHWHEAIVSNQKAVEADAKYRAIVGPPKDLIVMYAAHNGHMLAYAAMMTGQRELAVKQIRATVAAVPEEILKEWAPMMESFVAVPYEVLIRFGRWDEILAEPDHPDYMPFTRAFRHAARGVAFAAKGDVTAAHAEEAAYLAAAKKVPAEASSGNNPCSALLAVATPMLSGEILVREGKLEAGLAQLREAIKVEDTLKYDEPPGWILPVRHALGATLMQRGRFAEAEQVYRDDLARLPENGWSLFGLARSLRLQKKNDSEAANLEARFKKIWAKADLELTSSCLCQPGM